MFPRRKREVQLEGLLEVLKSPHVFCFLGGEIRIWKGRKERKKKLQRKIFHGMCSSSLFPRRRERCYYELHLSLSSRKQTCPGLCEKVSS